MSENITMRMLLKEQSIPYDYDFRQIEKKDINMLANLALESYRASPQYRNETLQDYRNQIGSILSGALGPWLESASLVVEEAGTASSATIVFHHKEANVPVLAFWMTHPDFWKQGYGYCLLKHSINELLRKGFQELHVNVSPENTVAYQLLELLGFEKLEE
ncbi:MAG: GNAT family N-acetyltransferase [Planctomycetota bacterium]|nr:MAG: GNAT family N-acetyltransferase [Planctomycetota bacterium]